jgi:hypothetical protein
VAYAYIQVTTENISFLLFMLTKHTMRGIYRYNLYGLVDQNTTVTHQPSLLDLSFVAYQRYFLSYFIYLFTFFYLFSICSSRSYTHSRTHCLVICLFILLIVLFVYFPSCFFFLSSFLKRNSFEYY